MASDDEAATGIKREASDEDGGGGGGETAAKKAKTVAAQKNSDGSETFFLLSAKRRLTVRRYKNTTFVDIREVRTSAVAVSAVSMCGTVRSSAEVLTSRYFSPTIFVSSSTAMTTTSPARKASA